MSGILRFLKKKDVILALMLVILIVLFAFIKLYLLCGIFALLLLTHFLLFMLSRVVIEKLMGLSQIFTAFGKIRNADFLIIGDMYDVQKKGKIVQLASPGRGIASCYEILRHTHSILKPNGEVIIAVNKRSINNPITAFDTIFFHSITIKRLHLEKIKQKEHRIAYFYPIKSLKYAMNIKSKKFIESQNIDTEIQDFCKERGYKLKFMVK